VNTLPVPVDQAAPPIEALLGTVTVRARLSVFKDEFRDLELPALLTVAEIIQRTGVVVPDQYTVIVWLQGKRLGSECFGKVRPKPGAIVNIAVLPQNARTALLIGGTIALAAGAAFAGPLVAGGLASLGAGAGLSAFGGAVAVGAIALTGELTLDATR
jgi:hypothetical protein